MWEVIIAIVMIMHAGDKMKKTIRDFNITNKKVIIRVDFNVPIQNGNILDDTRIKNSLKTIEYAVKKDAKIILLSHMNKVKTEEDKIKYTLKPVAKRLEELLKLDVTFIDETRGSKLEEKINNMVSGEIVLIENTRFEKTETKCDLELAKYWAELGEIFINDAFASSHRSHSSTTGIAKFIPSGIGFLVEKELSTFENIFDKKGIKTVILGGAKISDKMPLIENIVKKADYILIGGAMANTFLKAGDIEIGSSLVDLEKLDYCNKIYNEYRNKIILPVDCITNKNETKIITNLEYNDIILDIGPNTSLLFNKYINYSNLVVMNGPLGKYEEKDYSLGTTSILENIKKNKIKTIVGGGDTASAVTNLGYKDDVYFISTGGGASLKLLEGNSLVGVDAVENI